MQPRCDAGADERLLGVCGVCADGRTEFISNWSTFIETQPAFLGNGDEDETVYSMQMYAFDGQPYAKLYLVSDPPNMLPPEQLFMNVVGASS